MTETKTKEKDPAEKLAEAKEQIKQLMNSNTQLQYALEGMTVEKEALKEQLIQIRRALNNQPKGK